jgi:hypothetical protein
MEQNIRSVSARVNVSGVALDAFFIMACFSVSQLLGFLQLTPAQADILPLRLPMLEFYHQRGSVKHFVSG